MEIMLYRTYLNGGTNGEFYLGEQFICFSIELPWKQNQQNVSCIPESRYKIKKRFTLKHGHHFILIGVKNRAGILIHTANNAIRELRGCIAPVGELKGAGIGSQSGLAMQQLLKIITVEVNLNQNNYLTILNKEEEVCV